MSTKQHRFTYFNHSFEWLSILFHQFLQIGNGQKQIKQQDLAFLTGPSLLVFPVFSIIYIVHFFFNDAQKTPQELYVRYRFGVATGILLMGGLTYLFRRRAWIVRLMYLSLATMMSVIQAWSMTWGPQITIKWVVWLPAMIFIVTSNSFFFSTLWLGFLVVITKPFWEGYDVQRFLFSDFSVAIVAVFLSQVVKRISITSRINYILYQEMRAELEEEQKSFYNQMSRFVSPVLVERIGRARRTGLSGVAALDSVLVRRRARVAVLYSDIRNFSARADETEFIENELIPSSISVIDAAERNLGIAKQIGDAIIVFYDLEDPEESLLRAVVDGARSAVAERRRIMNLGRSRPERLFSIAYGDATVGNMASAVHREMTIIGYPANLSARIDGLTKLPEIESVIFNERAPSILLSESAARLVQTFSKKLRLSPVELDEFNIKIRSFPNEKLIYLFPVDAGNCEILDKLLKLNSMEALDIFPEEEGVAKVS